MSSTTSRRFPWPWLAVFVVGIVLGALVFGRSGSEAPPVETAATETIWTCSMHPQIRLPAPGKCPICFMDLIPASDGDDAGAGPTELAMSESAVALANIETRPVTRQFVEAELRAVGKVAVDERRMKKITAWVGGRLDRLYVDYTGVSVQAGDHLVDLYSPELYSAQVELIESLKAVDQLKNSTVEFMRTSAEATVRAAREKLRLLGLSPDQIKALESKAGPSDHITINAPISGVVVVKNALEGEYVSTGSPIYTIAELDHVWILIDIYESDLSWVRFGQNVEFQVEAFPGEVFSGRIAFIDPVVDPRTRTVRVRVNADNPGQRLKPDMFVRAVIRPRLTSDGRAVDPDLAGKWISPMHPEIVKDRPGSCDVCGMALVRAEELGFVSGRGTEGPPLVIPATAPLLTGKRAVVYVKLPGRDRPTFEGREVTLGPRAGGFYVVDGGLSEGEEVVAKGAFKIDSAMQIQAKPSMMSPDGGAPAPGHQHGGSGTTPPAPVRVEETPASFAASLAGFQEAYLGVQTALAGDNPDQAAAAAAGLHDALAQVQTGDLSPEGATRWAADKAALEESIHGFHTAKDLKALRAAFEPLSRATLDLHRHFRLGTGLHEAYCPMAFDNKGASWIQNGTDIRNPYFGASMLKCGEIRDPLPEASR